jgi:hypothetical protein
MTALDINGNEVKVGDRVRVLDVPYVEEHDGREVTLLEVDSDSDCGRFGFNLDGEVRPRAAWHTHTVELVNAAEAPAIKLGDRVRITDAHPRVLVGMTGAANSARCGRGAFPFRIRLDDTPEQRAAVQGYNPDHGGVWFDGSWDVYVESAELIPATEAEELNPAVSEGDLIVIRGLRFDGDNPEDIGKTARVEVDPYDDDAIWAQPIDRDENARIVTSWVKAPAETGAEETPETLEAFKARVAETAMRYAKREGLCGVVEQCLEELGIVTTVKETVTISVVVEMPIRHREDSSIRLRSARQALANKPATDLYDMIKLAA